MTQQLSLFGSPEENSGPQTVSEITTAIRQRIETDPALQDIWVEGEISNYKRAASGHLYFSLKDAGAQINCVMWKSATTRLVFEPAHGDQVTARGRISVYEPQGAYQLYVDSLQPVGMGDLNRLFEQLKNKLDTEGLFDPERKRNLPEFPRKIGVVTSPDAAAFQDVLNVLRRRYPAAEVVLSPTPVQGSAAPPRIIAALDRLNARDDIDVILIVRGGGSLEDLWSFNDENVVRAVAGSRIPTIAGVGHEIDFTLVDFAADRRAPTPSAAAEIATPDAEMLLYALREIESRMKAALLARIDEQRYRIEQSAYSLRLLSPANRVRTLRQKLDDSDERLRLALGNTLRHTRQKLAASAGRLAAASPENILKRGYAIVTRDGDGLRMNSVQQAGPGTTIRVQMHDGELKASVKERIQND